MNAISAHIPTGRQTKIIEFVGPPGAGKTTSCRHFSALLQQRGFSVFLLGDVKKYIRDMSSAAKVIFLLKTALYESNVLCKYTWSLFTNSIYSWNSIYRYFRLLAFKQALNEVLKSKRIDYIILEQWTIQELWSATIFRANTYDKLNAKLSNFYFGTDYVLYFDIDIETAASRIEGRETKLSRFDRMEANQRVNALIKYTSYLFTLFESSKCTQKYVLSTSQPINQNARMFMHYLNLN